MKISGFSFVRNGVKLYYPVVESIRSILPICDEFIVAVGEGDPDDTTREEIAAIDSPKVKIIDTEWDELYWKGGAINALQTDIALNECSGDWCFYLQADEVVHEKYLPVIRNRCEELFSDTEVEGLLFGYTHFWGDYNHHQISHGWYPNEIRIVRNLPEIHSWESAQSFRYFYEYEHPQQEANTRKLKVANVAAEIYHYGWVRPPHLMQRKNKALDSVHWGRERAESHYEKAAQSFDYGPLGNIPEFTGTHPEVMQERISEFDWGDRLNYGKSRQNSAPKHKHEKLKYRILTAIERILGLEEPLFGFKNYILLKDR